MNPHEEFFALNFITAAKRERYRSMLSSEKSRKKLISGFYHLKDLEERSTVEVPPNLQTVDKIAALLKEKGAPETCYVISTNPQIDQKQLPLADVLQEIVGNADEGTILSCIPGKLAYYEGEAAGARYILEKK